MSQNATHLSGNLRYDLRTGKLIRKQLVITSIDQLSADELDEAQAFFGLYNEDQLADFLGLELSSKPVSMYDFVLDAPVA